MIWDTIDILYVSFIALVIIGGIATIMILAPKENSKRQDTGNSYRFLKKNGEIKLAGGKTSLFEGGKYFYVRKGPYEADGFADGIKGADGKYYKGAALAMVYVPDSLAMTAAQYFCGMNDEGTNEIISETMSVALSDKLAEYTADTDEAAFKEAFRKHAEAKLMKLGIMIFAINSLKIAEDSPAQQ